MTGFATGQETNSMYPGLNLTTYNLFRFCTCPFPQGERRTTVSASLQTGCPIRYLPRIPFRQDVSSISDQFKSVTPHNLRAYILAANIDFDLQGKNGYATPRALFNSVKTAATNHSAYLGVLVDVNLQLGWAL